jgi:hypothetical protein
VFPGCVLPDARAGAGRRIYIRDGACYTPAGMDLGSEYNLRRAFAAQLGVVPSEYQARFG